MKRTGKIRRVVLLASSMVLLVCIAVGATIAWLTDRDTVTNTFTVGNVDITLNESAVNADGTKNALQPRVHANEYHLLPGHEYCKDPTVTIVGPSERAYVRLLMTINKPVNDIFGVMNAHGGYTKFIDLNTTDWIYKSYYNGPVTGSTTIEFWYKGGTDGAVPATASGSTLPLNPLFTKLTVPGGVTNQQLSVIQGLHIDIVAQAIQADGTGTATEAWSKFPA